MRTFTSIVSVVFLSLLATPAASQLEVTGQAPRDAESIPSATETTPSAADPAATPSPAPPIMVIIATEAPPATTPEGVAPIAVVSDVAMVGSTDAPEQVDDFRPGWLGLGASILLGTRPTNGGIGPTWLGGFDLAFRVDTHVALGIRRAHIGMMGDERYWTVGLSPFVELAMRPWERLDLYLQVGGALEVQVRTRDVSPEGFGVAPFLGGGARFYLAEFFSIAVEGAVHVPVIDGMSLGEIIAPAGSVYFLGGVALSFHIE